MKLKKARKIYAGQQNVMVSRKGKLVGIEDAPEKWDQRKVISVNKDGKMQIIILGKKAKKKDSESGGLSEGFDQFISEAETLIGGKDGKKKKKKHDKDKSPAPHNDQYSSQRMREAVCAAKTREVNHSQEEKKPEQKAPVKTDPSKGTTGEAPKRRPGRPPRNRKPEAAEKPEETKSEKSPKKEDVE